MGKRKSAEKKRTIPESQEKSEGRVRMAEWTEHESDQRTLASERTILKTEGTVSKKGG